MSAAGALRLAEGVLAAHVCIILFNVFGLVAIPLGRWLGWRFVRVAWWRLLHLVSMAAVAVQAAAGRACLLTIWQDALAGAGQGEQPLIVHWVNAVLFWPLPIRFFAVLYVVACGFVVALMWWVPVDWGGRRE